MQDYKKPLLIGASVAGVCTIFLISVFLGLFVKNYLQQKRFKPLTKQELIRIYRKIRKQNYLIYKQVTLVAAQLATQFKQITPDMIKGYLEGPQSPIKLNEMFQKNIKKVCQANNITEQQFQFNMNHYKNDQDIKKLLQMSERQLQFSLSGRIPPFPVNIPQSLTKQRILQIQSKVIKQKYLFQIGVLRKLRQYTKKQIEQNPSLMEGIPTPQTQQQMLQQQGLGQNDQPASAVLHAAIVKYRTDEAFRLGLTSIQNSFKNIYSRYEAKINSNKISEAQLTQLQDQIIYFQYI